MTRYEDDPLGYLRGTVVKLGADQQKLTKLLKAVVTRTNPLQIRYDEDLTPLDIVPDTNVSPLLPGERVTVGLQNGRITVLGVAGRRDDLRGTTAERDALALSGVLEQGMTFYDTQKKRPYIWYGNWQGQRVTRSGTAAQRAATLAEFGDIWKDTDSSGYTWKGSYDGRWRRIAAAVTFSSTGWNNSYGAVVWARTESYVFQNMWLEPGETLAYVQDGSGNGYEFSDMASRSNVITAGLPTALSVFWRKQSIGSSENQPSYYTVYIIENGE